MAKKRKYTKRAKPTRTWRKSLAKASLGEMAQAKDFRPDPKRDWGIIQAFAPPPLILWMVWVTNAGRYFGPFTDPKDVCSWALQKVGSTGWRIEEIHHPSTK